MAILINAYFDESSEGNSQNGLLSVSGYALDLAGVDALIPKWRGMLSSYHLPYFHMAECNVCCGIYNHLSDEECDNCAREAIALARSCPLHGYSFVVDQSEYREILEDCGFNCDPYSFLLWTGFCHVNKWVNANAPDKSISLFFESGYRTQKRANELLQVVTQDHWRGKNRVVRYSFVKKEQSEPTQAADLVAWHVRKGYENKKNGNPIRKDTLALLQDRRIYTIEYTSELLCQLRADFVERTGSLELAAKSLFKQHDPARGREHQ